MVKNEFVDIEIIYLGGLFAFLSLIEAKIYDFGFSEGFRGVLEPQKLKKGIGTPATYLKWLKMNFLTSKQYN